ncbi:MAG: peptidylprolyl isomerase [Verrucomicrobiota bacterium]
MKFCLVLLLAMTQFCCGVGAATELVNGIVVIVNDAVITVKDVQNAIAPDLEFLERHYGQQPPVLEKKIRELQQESVEGLVELQLVLHEFKTAGYSIPESYIENRIQEDIRKYGDRLTLTKTLQAQGVTYESYRTKMREKIILDLMWKQHVPNDPLISPHKIEKYYAENRDKFKMEDQVKLRLIVLTNRPNDRLYVPAKLAREILAKIEEGASFADMARVYSQGSQSVEGGDWGWVERSFLRPDLAEVAFSLKPGQRSDVVERPDGCYLMLVEESRLTHVKILSEVRDEIESTLKALENKRLRKQWIERLKTKSFVRYF